jgi:formate-dependent nitrite reductase membrane component NrfD
MIDRVQTGAGYVRRWSRDGGRRRRGERNRESAGAAPGETTRSYYGIPPIHKAHWRWPIVIYFFLGGISGASYVLAALANLLKPAGYRDIVRAGRYISLVTLVPGAIMLIVDLGRPERFLYMFRVIKLRSPMSLGTWGLSLFGAFSTVMAVKQAADDGVAGAGQLQAITRRIPEDLTGLLGTLPAYFISGYTGVLLGATAVPLWARNAILNGPLFIAASMSAAVAAVKLVIQRGAEPEAATRTLARIERISLAAEAALLVASYVRLGPLRRSATTGSNGRLLGGGTVLSGIVAPLVLGAIEERRPRRLLSAAASLLVLAGGLILRYVSIEAGHVSADDPESTFLLTRKSNHLTRG